MKEVMLSIKPKYCELIASGQKTIEVRKTRPKIETPFKCYIYMTKSNLVGDRKAYKDRLAGKVIGEFVCDCIIPISITYSDPNNRIAQKEFPYTCLTDKEIMDYLGNGNQGYGWHISNLVIYDEPKELSKFYTWCPEYEREYITSKCTKCRYYLINEFDGCFECACEGEKLLTRPPQSWCYVEV